MQKTLFRRIGSGLLSLLMMSTLAISPTLAADSRSESAAVSTHRDGGQYTGYAAH